MNTVADDLLTASYTGDLTKVKSLISDGADVNKMGEVMLINGLDLTYYIILLYTTVLCVINK